MPRRRVIAIEMDPERVLGVIEVVEVVYCCILSAEVAVARQLVQLPFFFVRFSAAPQALHRLDVFRK